MKGALFVFTFTEPGDGEEKQHDAKGSITSQVMLGKNMCSSLAELIRSIQTTLFNGSGRSFCYASKVASAAPCQLGKSFRKSRDGGWLSTSNHPIQKESNLPNTMNNIIGVVLETI